MADLSAANGTWVIDAAHTNIGFTARHLMVSKVRGNFTAFEGGFTIDAAAIGASSANLTIQAASINTGNADRDGHLISPDFLDVEEVGGDEVTVAVSVAGVDAGGLDGEVRRACADGGGVDGETTLECGEVAADLRHHQVTGGEADVGVGGVDHPGAVRCAEISHVELLS